MVWSAAPARPDLSEDEIHVWCASLGLEPGVLRELSAILAAEERSRAARLRFPRDRDSFIAARGILRKLLGIYLNRPPAELRFGYGPRGKPLLRTPVPNRSVRFNVSHSHGLALYAFTYDREVGIDVELIRPDVGVDELAERFFSPREAAQLRALPPESRPGGFFVCWTQKEAYVKARSDGLQIPLDSFDVSLTPGDPAELRSSDSERWSMRSFQPAPGFVAAVVGEGRGWQLRCLKWGA